MRSGITPLSYIHVLRGINTSLYKKGRPETGPHSKQKMYRAGFGTRSKEQTSLSHSVGVSDARLAIRFVEEPDRLQDSDHSGGVLRGVTQNPPSIHASGMAVRPLCLPTSHLRAYRIGTHAILLHLVLEGEQYTTSRLIRNYGDDAHRNR